MIIPCELMIIGPRRTPYFSIDNYIREVDDYPTEFDDYRAGGLPFSGLESNDYRAANRIILD